MGNEREVALICDGICQISLTFGHESESKLQSRFDLHKPPFLNQILVQQVVFLCIVRYQSTYSNETDC